MDERAIIFCNVLSGMVLWLLFFKIILPQCLDHVIDYICKLIWRK